MVGLNTAEEPVVLNSVFRLRNAGLRVRIIGSADHFYP
jgi:hypothetical protein